MLSIFNCAKVELLQVHFKYLAFKDYSKIIQSSSKVTLKHILGLILRKVHCAQEVCQIKFNYNVYIIRSGVICQ